MRIAEAATISGDETLSRAMSLLGKTDFLIVTDGAGKYAGVLSAFELERYTAFAPKTKVSSRAASSAVVSEGQVDAQKAIRLFADNKLEGLPVLDAGRMVKGVIDKACILEEAAGLAEAKRLKAGEFTEPLSSIGAGETAAQANGIMLRSGVRAIVVVEGKKAVGTVSGLDLARKVKPFMRQQFRTTEAVNKAGAEEATVGEIMAPLSEGGVIDGATTLAEAARRMAANGGRMLLVMDGGRLKGSLSFHGLLKAVAGSAEPKRALKVEIAGLSGEEKFMKESLEEECLKALSRMAGDASIQLRVKAIEKKKGRKEYEVSVRLFVGGKDLHCSTPDVRLHRAKWDLHLSVKEVLDELKHRYEREVKKG